MSSCTDSRFEEMLYAYELGMLSDEDEQQLELHLYECSHCFESARQFKDSSWLLRHSPQVRKQVKTDAEPKNTINITRILLIAALVVVVAIPVYKIGFDTGSSDAVQELYLVPFRQTAPTVIDFETGGTVQIKFVVEEAGPSDTLSVSIAARTGKVLYAVDKFSEFNESGQGTIELPVREFSQGFYNLTVTDPLSGDSTPVAQYPFRVK